MAFNSYFPAYQQSYYQPQQNPQPASLIWVASLSEAQMYPVAPNAAVALWDSTAPAIYLKQADPSGRPTMRIYDLVERVEATPEPAASYATRDDLAAFTAALETIRTEIESIRGDVYGIAGRRRTKKGDDEE